MITIYSATETVFTSLGLGALMPISCQIAEDINGQYELYMEHPVDENGKWEHLVNDRIIKAPTHDGEQLFRIYSAITNPITGRIDVNARHVFYDLLDNLIEDTRPTVKDGEEAGEAILDGCQYETPFSFTSDIEDVSTAYYIRVNPVQAFIGSALDQSFINRWGGEIRRNNYAISINERRGSDKGIRIAYGKNLTGLQATEDISSVYTRIMPTAVDASNVVFYTDAKYYDSDLIGNYAHPKIGVLNTGIRVGMSINGVVEYETEADAKTSMAAMAAAAFEEGADKPKLTINVSFIRWQDTDEYKAYKDLYALELGDDVTVDYTPLSLTYDLRVTSIVWDAVLNKAIALTLGDTAPNLVQSVVDSDISLAALSNDVAGAVKEGTAYNDVTITHDEGVVTSATIDGVLIEVKQNAQEGFALYADGDYVGGIKVIGGQAVLVSNMLTNDVEGDCYAVIGELVDSGITYKGIDIYDENNSTSVPSARILTLGGNVYIDAENGARLIVGSGFNLTDGDNITRLLLTDASNDALIYDTSGNIIFGHLVGTSTYLKYGSNWLGVDSTGVFKQIGSTKTYL